MYLIAHYVCKNGKEIGDLRHGILQYIRTPLTRCYKAMVTQNQHSPRKLCVSKPALISFSLIL